MVIGVKAINKINALVIEFEKSENYGTIGIQEATKICDGFNYAAINKLPVISKVCSGGIRVQEGTRALFQMINIISAIKNHSEQGLLYIAILTDTVLGGTSVCMISLADIIIAEKNSFFGFTGKRIIQNTTHEKLSEDFQTAEFAKKHGMIDIVAEKNEVDDIISNLLRIHCGVNEYEKN